MNLCLNARDAMPEGGRLLLQTDNVVLGPDEARLWLEARSGEFVRLQVRDTGAGMTTAVRAHLRAVLHDQGPQQGNGPRPGDGLWHCQAAWRLDCVRQRAGQGHLLHPAPAAPLATGVAAAEDSTRNDGPGRGTETILFVDDEAMLRNLGRTILQRHGYQVLLASDGLQAVEVFGRERRRIDLVVLDLTMPRLSGRGRSASSAPRSRGVRAVRQRLLARAADCGGARANRRLRRQALSAAQTDALVARSPRPQAPPAVPAMCRPFVGRFSRPPYEASPAAPASASGPTRLMMVPSCAGACRSGRETPAGRSRCPGFPVRGDGR